MPKCDGFMDNNPADFRCRNYWMVAKTKGKDFHVKGRLMDLIFGLYLSNTKNILLKYVSYIGVLFINVSF
jgi:hypothetical protein